MKPLLIMFLALLFFNKAAYSQVGINTITPTNTLHVKGDGTTNPLRFEGLQAKGTETQALFIDGNGVVKKGETREAKGSLYNTYSSVSDLAETTVISGTSADLVNISVVVPATVPSQTLVITVTGYGSSSGTNPPSQGAIELYQDTSKIAAGCIQSTSRLTASITFQKTVTLTPGTYSFKVKYTHWNGSTGMVINKNRANDPSAQLTRMTILAYND